MPKLPEPTVMKEGSIFKTLFSSANQDNFADYSLAFVKAVANGYGKIALRVLTSLKKEPVNSPEEFSARIDKLQTRTSNKLSKFTGIKVTEEKWLFQWVCYPYARVRTDLPSVPEKPMRTNIKLTHGPGSFIQLEISGGRETSVKRHAESAMGKKNVPFAWKVIRGVEEHPKL